MRKAIVLALNNQYYITDVCSSSMYKTNVRVQKVYLAIEGLQH